MATNKEVGATPNLTPTEVAQFLAALGALSDSPPFTDGLTNVTFEGFSLDVANGRYQQVTFVGDDGLPRTLSTISNGSVGKMLKLRMINPTTQILYVDLSAVAIKPDEYVGPWPIFVPVNRSRTVMFNHNGTTWELQTIGGAFAI